MDILVCQMYPLALVRLPKAVSQRESDKDLSDAGHGRANGHAGCKDITHLWGQNLRASYLLGSRLLLGEHCQRGNLASLNPLALSNPALRPCSRLLL